MSTDFKEETHHVLETREPQSEEEIIKILTEEFNSMFTRENIEANPYLIFQLNSSLEIPVTAIYKDKRISNICTNLAIIREALSNSTSVTYDRVKEILIPKIKAMKNKIILNKIPDNEKDALFKVIYQSPEYLQKISDKYIDNLKSYTIILRSEEHADSIAEKIKAACSKTTTLEFHQEYEDLYLDLLQKAQDVLKYQSANPDERNGYGYDMYYQNYNYYYGMNPFANSYGGRMGGNPYSYRAMNNSNQYYNNYYNNMFIRKAQDEQAEAEPQRGEYQGRHGRRKDNNRNSNKKPHFNKKSESDHKHQAKPNVSEEEIKRRTRVNSENFPPLMGEAKEEVPEPKVELVVAPPEHPDKNKRRYDKDDFIKIFKQNGDKIKPNERLFKMNENVVPVLQINAKANLEFIEPAKKTTETPISRKATEDQK